jgi:hypothetical protein
MNIGHLYFLKEKYFSEFPDPFLEKNKEILNGEYHNRPCFYAFIDNETGLFWLIPFSSKLDKYRKIYRAKIKRNKKCDTIVFGNVMGEEKAFLIQNMCPATDEYIESEYFDHLSNSPITLSLLLESELIQKAKSTLSLQRRGRKLIFPDVLKIEKMLLEQL